MQGNLYTYTGAGLQPFQNPEEARTQPLVLGGGVNYPAGQVMGQVPGTGTAVNEVQNLVDTGATAGTFKLGFGDQVTPTAIAYNASAATIQAALEALSTIGTGNVVCAGGPLPTAVTATFQGRLAGVDVAMLYVVSPALTGGSMVITETTKGKPARGFWKDYNDALSDGSQQARAILQEAVETNADGSIKTLSGGPPLTGLLYATGYVCGTFLGSELTGLDANGLADMAGRVIAGVPGTLTDPTTIIRFP